MPLPKDVNILRNTAAPWPFDTFRWLEPGFVPAEYLEPSSEIDLVAARAEIFRQLTFIAEDEESGYIALWQYHDDVSPDRAPVVYLDSEGSFSVTATSLADHGIQSFGPDGDTSELLDWLDANGIHASRNWREVMATVRFMPDPNERFEALLNGETSVLPPKTSTPRTIEDLIGMSGQDSQVEAFLKTVESPELPIELQCDRDGRIKTIFLTEANLLQPVLVRGISLGQPESATDRLGAPTRSGSGWKRWDDDHLALHVTVSNGVISRISLMATATLPKHL
jgi:hypothetical protein